MVCLLYTGKFSGWQKRPFHPHTATSCFIWVAGMEGVSVYVCVCGGGQQGAPVAFGRLHHFWGPKRKRKKENILDVSISTFFKMLSLFSTFH